MSPPEPPDQGDPADGADRAHRGDPPPEVVDAVCRGPWRAELIARRIAHAQGRFLVTTDIHDIARALVAAFPDGAGPREVTVFWRTLVLARHRTTAGRTPSRTPPPLAHLAALPVLAAVLDVPVDELAELARLRRPDADDGPPRARHYHYAVRATRGGGVRVVEAPKERLKEVQRRILRRILDAVPVEDASFGVARGRGAPAAAGRHAATRTVVSLDIERFFTAVTVPRVVGWFAGCGAAPDVARLLGRLTTNAVPLPILRTLPLPADPDRARAQRRELATRHLPQGAPTSPAIADRLCRSLDRRLGGLAARQGARYTRYVDDLTFSGDDLHPARLVAAVTHVVADEGFRLATGKTRVQRASGRQAVLGAVVNAHPTLGRAERDALRATVHNCRVHGWRTQLRAQPADGFRERLQGRVAWLASLDPVRGRALLAELGEVSWS